MQPNKYQLNITRYYSENTPINCVINNILAENDDFLISLYEQSLEYEKTNKNIINLTDIIAIQYCSIRCIYDMPDLCNINYRNSRPTANIVFGEDKTLLSAMIIQVDCVNALLHFLNDYYPNKVENAQIFIDKILNLDNDIDIISNTVFENKEVYKKQILTIFKDLITFLFE
jgi:hypothetical protein